MRIRLLISACVFCFIVNYAHATADHVFYVGSDGHIHEDYFASGAWHTSDTTVDASAPVPNTGSSLAGIVVGQSGSVSSHVFFIETNGDIGEAYFNGQWHYTNDTQVAGAVAAFTTSSLIAIKTGTYSFHVFFEAADYNLGEIWFDGSKFHYDEPNTLTSLAPQPATGSLLGAVAFKGGEYVFYIGTDFTLGVLSYTTFWNYEGLMGGFSGNSPLTAFQYGSGTGNTVEVAYDDSQALGEWSSTNGATWNPGSIYQATQVAFDPISPTVYGSGAQHVDLFYVGTPGFLTEVRQDAGYRQTLPGPFPHGQYDGMGSLYGLRGVEVYYPDTNLHLEEVYGNESSWTAQDLTMTVGSPTAQGAGLTVLEY